MNMRSTHAYTVPCLFIKSRKDLLNPCVHVSHCRYLIDVDGVEPHDAIDSKLLVPFKNFSHYLLTDVGVVEQQHTF